MCDYCGCRGFPVIARLSEEHWRIQEAAGALRRAILAGDDPGARRLLSTLTGLLAPHVLDEEQGLFAELRDDETVRATIEQLCAEHGDLAAALRPPDPDRPDWTPALAALQRLRDHIDKEEHGLFPAAAVVLPMAAWERITQRDPGPRQAAR